MLNWFILLIMLRVIRTLKHFFIPACSAPLVSCNYARKYVFEYINLYSPNQWSIDLYSPLISGGGACGKGPATRTEKGKKTSIGRGHLSNLLGWKASRFSKHVIITVATATPNGRPRLWAWWCCEEKLPWKNF